MIPDVDRHGFGSSSARLEVCDGMGRVVQDSETDTANLLRMLMFMLWSLAIGDITHGHG
jgi:hypothetical protein